MRAITNQEQAAVAGGIDQVIVPAKKKDDGSATSLQMSIKNSGNSAGSTGGGGKAASSTYDCTETIQTVCQTRQVTSVKFGLTEASMTQTPGGCVVTTTSVCSKTNSSK